MSRRSDNLVIATELLIEIIHHVNRRAVRTTSGNRVVYRLCSQTNGEAVHLCS